MDSLVITSILLILFVAIFVFILFLKQKDQLKILIDFQLKNVELYEKLILLEQLFNNIVIKQNNFESQLVDLIDNFKKDTNLNLINYSKVIIQQINKTNKINHDEFALSLSNHKSALENLNNNFTSISNKNQLVLKQFEEVLHDFIEKYKIDQNDQKKVIINKIEDVLKEIKNPHDFGGL